MAARRTDAGSGDGGLGAEEVGTRRPDLSGPSGVVVGGGVGPARGHFAFPAALAAVSQTPGLLLVLQNPSSLPFPLMAEPSLVEDEADKGYVVHNCGLDAGGHQR